MCVCFLVCQGDYDIYMGRIAEGGTPYPQLSTVSDCAAMCHSMDTCTAFDFDKSAAQYHCWIHDKSKPLVMKKQTQVDLFVKKDCPEIVGMCHVYI